MILNQFNKKSLKKILLLSILMFSLTGMFVYSQNQSNTEYFFPYEEFPEEKIEFDTDTYEDRNVLTADSIKIFGQYLKGFLILPREYLYVVTEKENATEEELEKEYTGPFMSYSENGFFLNKEGEVQYDEGLIEDPVRNKLCSIQGCDDPSIDGCILPEWRFNSETFCRRELPLCWTPTYGTSSGYSNPDYFHPLNGQGYLTSNYGDARKVIKNGQEVRVNPWRTGEWQIVGGDGTVYSNGDWDRVIYAHEGIDLGTGGVIGVPIYAVQDGIIEYAGRNGSYGQFVVIKHSTDGLYSIYAHMPYGANTVNTGDPVKRGDVIGAVGSTGNSTGPHLHFELRKVGTNFATYPFGRDSWNGTNDCLTRASSVLGLIGESNCPSNIDPSFILDAGSSPDIEVGDEGSNTSIIYADSVALPMCDVDPCGSNLSQPNSLGCMINIISEVTEVPKELLYAIMMNETGGKCAEIHYSEGGEIKDCTGNPLEVAWASPTPQLAGSSQDIRGITQTSVSEINYAITQFGGDINAKGLFYQCVEAATGMPPENNIEMSSNPSLAVDPKSENKMYSRHIVAHSLCITALKLRRDGAEWNEWRLNPSVDDLESYTATNIPYRTLTLEEWYDFIQSDMKANVNLNWFSSPPYKEYYNLIYHIGRRYYGTCVHPMSVSGYNRDIYYCKDLTDKFNNYLQDQSIFNCDGNALGNVSSVGIGSLCVPGSTTDYEENGLNN